MSRPEVVHWDHSPLSFLQNASDQDRSSLFDPQKAVKDRPPEPSSFMLVLTDSCQNFRFFINRCNKFVVSIVSMKGIYYL